MRGAGLSSGTAGGKRSRTPLVTALRYLVKEISLCLHLLLALIWVRSLMGH